MKDYGANGANLVLFGIPIQEYGDTDPAITIEDIEPRNVLKRGIGGSSVNMSNKTNPKRLTVNLVPDSDEVRQIIAASKTGTDATFSFSQLGTGEKIVGFDGVLINRGQMGRAGKTTVTDEQFIFEFSDSEES